jgi:hypothetical protein
MRISIGKVLAACVASMVLASAIGCGDSGKSPPRTVDDTQQKGPVDKPGEQRR